MDAKKGLLFGAAVYLIPFLIAAAISSATGGTSVRHSQAGGLAGLVATVVVLVLLSLRYFKTAAPSSKEGFLLGVVVAVVGLVIDTLVILATDTARPVGNLNNPLFWLAAIAVILIATAVGFLKGRKAAVEPAQ